MWSRGLVLRVPASHVIHAATAARLGSVGPPGGGWWASIRNILPTLSGRPSLAIFVFNYAYSAKSGCWESKLCQKSNGKTYVHSRLVEIMSDVIMI